MFECIGIKTKEELMYKEVMIGGHHYRVIPVVEMCGELITENAMLERAKILDANNGMEEFNYVLENAHDFLNKGLDGKCFVFTECVSVEHGDRFYACIHKQPGHEKWLRHKATNRLWGYSFHLLQRVRQTAKFIGQLGQ
ncbi:MAG: hypothetical protein A2469_04220 [Candidatus Magasanikbacteria bacterium RIFOXYC2_FULL_40_16]|uniref:Uncharacterized protein n=2 Tax=Candidatus Magasanikiibacteriota TaxID=1752731 RepID=A0A1F6NHK3_9BACT|nr:MAG: hypothetical protein A2224_02710 [Candidatus Magasanikbacteria bacterium RIFOXYA2_FULL_40_20]OGH83304.1 MAG: hypothetical protein A2373_00090 [Candidatus Magasanikbacteria bacterium RIFOXYB1_FULL_40_15]OGH89204.1 MAG: hypothetical protein A2469_04220 [Candidatus Magasanikbacteria bacterium RIFOXYC2_FULL_40_16]